jgi:hypothetical protein
MIYLTRPLEGFSVLWLDYGLDPFQMPTRDKVPPSRDTANWLPKWILVRYRSIVWQSRTCVTYYQLSPLPLNKELGGCLFCLLLDRVFPDQLNGLGHDAVPMNRFEPRNRVDTRSGEHFVCADICCWLVHPFFFSRS